MELTLVVSRRGHESLIEAAGVLDYASVPYLRQVAFERFDAGSRRIVVEASRLRLLDAASIRVLLYLHHRAAQLGADLRVAGAGGTVLSALEIAGVAKRLGAYLELDWPVADRDRSPVDLESLRIGSGRWPAEATEALARLRQLDPADPERQRTRNAVIELCLPTARWLARRFTGGTEPPADLAQVASLGLVKAVDGFDAARGVDFGAYATPTILGELKRYFRDRTGGVRLPRRLQELRLRVNRARDELALQLGRSPRAGDVAEHLAVDPEEVLEVVAAGYVQRPMSLDAPVRADGEEATLADLVGDEDAAFGLVDFRESVVPVIARLPEREQRILALRFHGNLTQAEIAARLGLSQMHVSRLLAHALDFLRRRLAE